MKQCCKWISSPKFTSNKNTSICHSEGMLETFQIFINQSFLFYSEQQEQWNDFIQSYETFTNDYNQYSFPWLKVNLDTTVSRTASNRNQAFRSKRSQIFVVTSMQKRKFPEVHLDYESSDEVIYTFWSSKNRSLVVRNSGWEQHIL